MFANHPSSRLSFLLSTAALVILCSTFVESAGAAEEECVKVGLVTALSGTSALSGETIMRSRSIAIDEISAHGGVLGGRKLVLVRRADESNPTKGNWLRTS